jgi:glucosamine-6-phosphate deaminase
VKEFNYLNGDTGDARAEAHRYEELLRAHPLDLTCCGIGENGHLAFNDPPVADFEDPRLVKVVVLEPESRNQQVGEGHFPSIDDVPTHAITVTIPALVAARRVLAIVPESRKAPAVHAALYGPISTACPASYLRRQEQATLYLDADSAAGLE